MSQNDLTRTLLSVETLVLAICEQHGIKLSYSGPNLESTLYRLRTPGLPYGLELPIVTAAHYILTNGQGVTPAEADAFVDALRWGPAPDAIAKPALDNGCMSGCAITSKTADVKSACGRRDRVTGQQYTTCRVGIVMELLRVFDKVRTLPSR